VNHSFIDGNERLRHDTRYYDPSKITVPVLLIHAEWDVETPAHMSQALFARPTGAPSSATLSSVKEHTSSCWSATGSSYFAKRSCFWTRHIEFLRCRQAGVA